jgi:glycosyltransferase involved in cell wall biosynthesis
MKKIVHVVDYLMPDMGYQEFLLPKWNAKSDYDVYIITSDRYTPFDNYVDTWGKILGDRICGEGETHYKGVNIIRLPVLLEFKSRPCIKGLARTINKLEPDLLFIHGTGSFSIYQCAFSLSNAPFQKFADNHMIVDVIQRGWIQSIYYFLHKFFMKRFLSQSIDLFFGVTKDSCDYLETYEGVPKEKLRLLSLGVDTEIFYPIEEYKNPKSDSLIVQSGKLNHDKKPQWTAKAVLSLLEAGKDITLKFIGNGSIEIMESIKQDFYNKGFEDRLDIVDLLPLSDLAVEFNKADLVVFPDGTSLSAVEAAACNTEVLMTDLPASVEREKNGIGKTYPRGNIDSLASTINSLIEDKEKLHQMGKVSGENARKLYSYDSISKKMLELAKLD